MEIQKLFFKTKLQSTNLILLNLSLLTMFLPFYRVVEFDFFSDFSEYLGQTLRIKQSYSYFEIASLLDIFTLLATIVAIGFCANVVYMVYRDKVDKKFLMLTNLVCVFASVLNIALVVLMIMVEGQEGLRLAYGFYLFFVLNLTIVLLSVYKVMKNQKVSKKVLNEVNNDIKERVEELQR